MAASNKPNSKLSSGLQFKLASRNIQGGQPSEHVIHLLLTDLCNYKVDAAGLQETKCKYFTSKMKTNIIDLSHGKIRKTTLSKVWAAL